MATMPSAFGAFRPRSISPMKLALIFVSAPSYFCVGP
jgi:hypothetical protein